MNQTRIDVLTRSLTSVPSRREVLRGLAGAGLAFGLARSPLDAAAKERKPRRKKGLCQKDGSPCRKPGKKCKQRYCRRAPFTIEARWTQTGDHDTFFFVPPENAVAGPAPFINQYCTPTTRPCTQEYPFACANGNVSTVGAEVTALHRLLPGTYEYWIELDGETPAGGVTVVLKNDTGRVVRRWTNPANPSVPRAGWHVFDIDGRLARVTSVGSEDAGPTGLPSPRTYVCPQ